MSVNQKYSYKSFKRQDLRLIDPSELNNSEIIGTSFYQSRPYTDVFPNNIVGVTFTRCNLDNCNIPVGSTVNGGTNKHFLTQNDACEWIVDRNLKPTAPLHEKDFDEFGISKDPKDIPSSKLEIARHITLANERIEIINKLKNDDVELERILVESGKISTRRIK